MATRRPFRAVGSRSPSTGLALTVVCALNCSSAWAQAAERDSETSPAPGAPSERIPALQWDVGLLAGMAGTGDGDTLWQSTRFAGAVRGDALFGRERATSYGYGPYATISTVGFDDARFGLGGSALLPVLEDFPLVLSLGGMARVGDGDTRPGAEAWLFWGARSFNFHGSYNLSNGLVLGAQTTFEREPEHALWLAAQVDAQWPLLPFMLLFGALQGS